jgi:diguanylate cyclase (GGDEF)-like protein
MLSIEMQRSLLISTSLVLLIMTSGFAALKIYYLGLGQFPYPAVVVSICLLSNICYIKFGGELSVSKLLTMLTMIIGFAIAAVNTGGYSGAPISLAPVLPMTAILWFDRVAGWFVAGVTVVLLIVILVADIFGLLPPNPQTVDGLRVAHFFTASIVTLVCTWLAWTVAQTQEVHIDMNRHDAVTDHLTNLANRRALDETMLREVGRAKRGHGWFSFALLDVDNFKLFNDSRGHQAGDQCLVQIAKLISENLRRPTDIAARFGGEEFAIILPDTEPEGAYQLVESIREQMASLNLTYTEKSDTLVSVTVGLISIAGSRISSIEDIVKEADAALYRGKSGGRNQVVMKTFDGPSLRLVSQNYS